MFLEKGSEFGSLLLVLLLYDLLMLALLLEVFVLLEEGTVLLDVHLALQKQVLFHSLDSIDLFVLLPQEFSIVIVFGARERCDLVSPHFILQLTHVTRNLGVD